MGAAQAPRTHPGDAAVHGPRVLGDRDFQLQRDTVCVSGP